ncbi:MAG TPA: ABC transporter permease [Dongiaceae bacterium]|nr:ABC transporter permease [Dongiaceae bacterium]
MTTNYVRLAWLDTRITTLELLRLPAYVIPTLVLPAMVYAFFGLGYASTPEYARLTVGSYAAFAVIGVALFQFGVGIASDRVSPWESYMRTLPIPGSARFLARLASAIVFAGAAASLVCLLGATAGHVAIPALGWVELAATLLGGGIVFGLVGIAIGYWTSAKAAVPIANLVYLPLAYAGGLWIPPQMLPSFVATISPFTPTRQYGELVWAAVTGQALPASALEILALYAVLFFGIAYWGYRRNEGQRYS